MEGPAFSLFINNGDGTRYRPLLLPLSQISDSLPDTNKNQPPKKDDSCRTKSDKRYN